MLTFFLEDQLYNDGYQNEQKAKVTQIYHVDMCLMQLYLPLDYSYTCYKANHNT